MSKKYIPIDGTPESEKIVRAMLNPRWEVMTDPKTGEAVINPEGNVCRMLKETPAETEARWAGYEPSTPPEWLVFEGCETDPRKADFLLNMNEIIYRGRFIPDEVRATLDSDTAAAMLGLDTGLVTLLKTWHPWQRPNFL